MNKLVKSTDTRKPAILQAFKQLFHANKVTNVREIGAKLYSANCFKHLGNRQYESIGNLVISGDELTGFVPNIVPGLEDEAAQEDALV